MRRRVAIAALWTATTALVAAAQPGAGAQVVGTGLPSADAVVHAVLTAPSLIDYEGTKLLTAVRGERVETVTILESSKRLGKLRLEFLSPESVSGRLIVDDGVTAWQYEPSLHLVVRGPSFAGSPASAIRLDEIPRYYAAEVLGAEEVIGRQTVVLALTPRATGVSRRFWVDQSTGVILRTEARDARGSVLFTSFFTRISFSLNLPSALFRFHLPAGARIFSFYLAGDPIAAPQALRQEAGFAVRVPEVLPVGYRFRDGTVARYGALAAAAATYTDGLSVLTIFQTPSSRLAFPQAGERIQLHGGRARFLDLGYFRMLMWESRGVSLAAIGTLPATALVMIADELNAMAR